MISGYLNQTCQYEILDEAAGLDLFGGGAYFAPISIPCRRELAETEIKDKSGKTVLSSVTYFLDTTVEPAMGDRIDGRLVLGLQDYTLGSGVLIGWEVYA